MLFRFQPRRAATSSLLAALLMCPLGASAQTAVKPLTPPVTAEELNTLLGGPTLVNYSGKDVPVEEVGQALLEAIGFPPLPPHRYREKGVPKTISVDWKSVPFWTAAREFETLTGLTWYQTGKALELEPDSETDARQTNGVLITDSPWVKIAGAEVKHTTKGALLLGAQGDKPTDPVLDTELTLTAYLDPKLTVDIGGLTVTGVTLPPDPAPGASGKEISFSYHVSRPRLAVQLEVPLPPGQKSGTVIPKVSGVLRTAVITQLEVWKVPDLAAAAGTAQTVGGTRYVIESVRPEVKRLVLQLSGTKDTPLRPDGQPQPLPPFLKAKISQLIQVRDVQGRLLGGGFVQERISDEPEGRRKGVLTIPLETVTMRGDELSGPYSLEWTLPVVTRSFETPFEIKDLKVP